MTNQDQPHSNDSISRDSLSASLVFLAVAQILQRSVGLGRNILFCGLLSDAELGRWSLTFNFLMLAAPLIVLGLPGSFGRYVEHYRQRGHLRSFLLRTGGVTLIATVLATLLQLLYPHAIAQLIFGDTNQATIIPLLAGSLCFVIIFNFLVELFTAMRLVRYAAVLQLASSLGFAATGAALLYFTPRREDGLVIAYGAASLFAVGIGLCFLARCWSALPQAGSALTHHTMWFKLLPFAGWMWATNLVSNLFDVADQFMLKHFSDLPAAAADALIGQYYSSRVIPVLLVALAGMVGSSLLPHLSHDWEAGRQDLVRVRMRLAVKLTVLFFTAAAAVVLLTAPTLFTWFLGAKFAVGMAVLPGTLMYCVWYSTTCIVLLYLLCAEAAHLSSFAFLMALIANVALNFVLAPVFGLVGVVVATAAANATALLLVIWLCHRKGMIWGPGIYAICSVPLCLCLGGPAASSILLIVVLGGWQSGRLFDDRETTQIRETWRFILTKISRIWGGSSPTILEEIQC